MITKEEFLKWSMEHEDHSLEYLMENLDEISIGGEIRPRELKLGRFYLYLGATTPNRFFEWKAWRATLVRQYNEEVANILATQGVLLMYFEEEGEGELYHYITLRGANSIELEWHKYGHVSNIEMKMPYSHAGQQYWYLLLLPDDFPKQFNLLNWKKINPLEGKQ